MAKEINQIIEHLQAAKDLLDKVEENAASNGLVVDNVDIARISEQLDAYANELTEIDDFEFHRVGGEDDNDDDDAWKDFWENIDDYDPVDEF